MGHDSEGQGSEELAVEHKTELLSTSSGGPSRERTHEVEPELVAGEQLVDRYTIGERMGRGAVGVVYAAHDAKLGRRVALKILYARGDAARESIEREARAMAKLSHPNVVAVHDVGMLGERQVFMAMDFVDGGSLRDWMSASSRGWREVLAVFRGAGAGLAAAHRAGMIHRDFKPDNVLVTTEGRALVTDFGVAKLSTDDDQHVIPSRSSKRPSAPSLTEVGSVIGTPPYLSPERIAGEPSDERSDLFAFVISLYECLYGVRPFDRDAVDAKRWEIIRQPAGPRRRSDVVPAWLEKVVLRGLARDPSQRYPDLATFLEALSERHTTRYVLLAAAVSLVGVGALVAYARSSDEAPAAAPCPESAFAWTGVWDADKRAQLERAFAASQAVGQEVAFANTAESLDRKTAAWSADARTACVDTRVRGIQSDELLTLRATCYSHVRSEIEALVDVLVRADASAVSKSLASTYALPDLELCRDVVALRSPVPLPAARRDAVEDVYRRLARAQALQASGDSAAAATTAHAVVVAAQATEYEPVWAQALLVEGRMLVRAANPDAESVLQRAVFVAEEARDLETKLAAAIELAHYYSSSSEKAKLGLLAGFAKAYFTALGEPPRLQAAMLYLASLVEHSNTNHDAKLALLARALEADRKQGARNPIFTATILHSVATTYGDAGRFDEAAVASKDVAALQERLFGSRSVELATTYMNRAIDLARIERCDEALPLAERALAIAKHYEGQQGLRWRVHGVMGTVQLCSRHHEVALQYFETVSREADAAKVWIAELARVEEALALVQLGRAREGRERAVRAVAKLEEVLGKDNVNLIPARNSLAEAELALGNPTAARAALAPTLALAKTTALPPWDLVRTHFTMARALAALHAPAAEVTVELEAAIAIARTLKLARLLTELEAWDQRRRCCDKSR